MTERSGHDSAMPGVELRRDEGIALIVLRAPPVNALCRRTLGAVLACLDAALGDPSVRAVVLAADGRHFSAGADLREEGTGGQTAADAVADRLEAADRPVIAALQGPALGTGAGLALAAHWRLAAPGASLAWPDLALRRVPEAGATQRLPRLIGAAAALDLLLGGQALAAPEALRLGLVDGIPTGCVRRAACDLARTLVARGLGPRPARLRRDRLDPGAHLAAVAGARRHVADPAGLAIADCVEAALLLPWRQGLDYERARREEMAARPEAQALRRIFLAERQAPPALVVRAGGVRRLTPAGEALADRLATALGQAAGALARLGHPRSRIDAALVDWGMPSGPFGGETGGAGPAGLPLRRRLLAALVAEGARLLAEGAVDDPATVDALAVIGLGVPALSGGPFGAAALERPDILLRDMEAWAADDPVWSAPPLLREMAASGFGAGLRPAA